MRASAQSRECEDFHLGLLDPFSLFHYTTEGTQDQTPAISTLVLGPTAISCSET